MNTIRNLLLDCRAALRRSDHKFESTPLAEILDDEIIRIGRESEPPPPSEEPVAKPHGHRIAYAWQAAARELRATHPEIHDLLSKRVHERLREKVLDDSAHEIEALRAQLQTREAACARLDQDLAEARADLEAVRHSHAPTPIGVAACGPVRAVEDPRVPTMGMLQAVAAGTSTLSEPHRDWCLAEAMVLTGFERTPVQLMEDGEAALASLILGGKAAAA